VIDWSLRLRVPRVHLTDAPFLIEDENIASPAGGTIVFTGQTLEREQFAQAKPGDTRDRT
jgi:hypothetical protein